MTGSHRASEITWPHPLRASTTTTWTVRCVCIVLTLTAGFAVAMTAAVALAANPDGREPPAGMWVVLATLFIVWAITAGRLVWRTAGPVPGGLPMLPDPADMAVLVRAHSLATVVVRSWPVLGVLGQPSDPVPTLEAALRELHTTLADRHALRTAYRQLAGARCPVTGIAQALRDRRRLVLDRIRRHDSDIAHTVAWLAALVTACSSHRALVASCDRANRVIAEVDEVLCRADGRGHRSTEDSLADVAERTAAAVGAYRELGTRDR